MATNRMQGKVCLVTGSSSGMGLITARELARMGASVVMLCRNRVKGEAVQAQIKAASGNTQVDLLVADLSDLSQVRRAANELKQRYPRLHVLINNAGGMNAERRVTSERLEATFVTNYLAPFLLTQLLLDVLLASAPARIINVSAPAHKIGKIDFANLQGEQHYNALKAYAQAKLAQISFTYELAERLAVTGITVNALDPGHVVTNFNKSTQGLMHLIAEVIYFFDGISPEKGAQTILYLATSPEVEGVSGKYFLNCKPIPSSRRSYDMTVRQHLWNISEALIIRKEDNTMINPLRQLEALGQSVWLDDIDRMQLRSGLFEQLITEDGLGGATGNPTIFEHAIDHSTAYDEQMRQLIAGGKEAQVIYETLAMTDVRQVADLLRPTYERTDGQDGFVSIEVSPYLAHDTERTLAEVRRFWQTIERPNLLVKIPATPAGIPAIRQALAEGININITLIFSIENYRQVAEAYLNALEERVAAGQDISRIASIASFFISRVDVLIDQLLEDRAKASGTNAQQLKDLEGKAAIANARLAYQEFKQLFGGPRFAALRNRGARVQRPLWASTSTKNPAYRDVLYVEELIGPDTVNTMPLKTLESFREHGNVRLSIEDQLQEAQASLSALAEAGISYDEVTRQLQEEGVQKFIDSFQTLFTCIDRKR